MSSAYLAGRKFKRDGPLRLFTSVTLVNFDGDHALAAAFLPAVARVLGLPPSDIGEGARSLDPASRPHCAEVLAFTEWDEIGVRSAMLRMTAKAPFQDQLEHAERQAEAEELVRSRIAAFGRDAMEAAAAVYQSAIRKRPEDSQLRQNYGTLLMDFGNSVGAASEYGKAVKLMPIYPALRLMLARAQWEQGKQEEAITEVREILRLAPYYSPAREALDSMTGRQR